MHRIFVQWLEVGLKFGSDSQFQYLYLMTPWVCLIVSFLMRICTYNKRRLQKLRFMCLKCLNQHPTNQNHPTTLPLYLCNWSNSIWYLSIFDHYQINPNSFHLFQQGLTLQCGLCSFFYLQMLSSLLCRSGNNAFRMSPTDLSQRVWLTENPSYPLFYCYNKILKSR